MPQRIIEIRVASNGTAEPSVDHHAIDQEGSFDLCCFANGRDMKIAAAQRSISDAIPFATRWLAENDDTEDVEFLDIANGLESSLCVAVLQRCDSTRYPFVLYLDPAVLPALNRRPPISNEPTADNESETHASKTNNGWFWIAGVIGILFLLWLCGGGPESKSKLHPDIYRQWDEYDAKVDRMWGGRGN